MVMLLIHMLLVVTDLEERTADRVDLIDLGLGPAVVVGRVPSMAV